MTSLLYVTPWKRLSDGWCIAARAYARVMHESGIWLNILDAIDQEEDVLNSEVRAEMGAILDAPMNPRPDYGLYSGVLRGYEGMRPYIQGFIDSPMAVGYHCFFERLNLEPKLVQDLARVSVCTTSKGNYHVLRAHGLTDVTRFPYPWFPDGPLRRAPVSDGNTRFYWIGRFEPRKAADRLIRAFMRAFKPAEARLTMKLSPYVMPGYDESPEAVILSELSSGVNHWTATNWTKDITLIRDKLSRRDMIRLHATNDIYVSPSHGEGLELGAWDAKQAGRKLITTESGGPEDYLCDNDIRIPSNRLTVAHPCYDELWGSGGTYSDYRIDDLIDALQRARSSVINGKRFSSDEHKSENVGRIIKQWIENRIPVTPCHNAHASAAWKGIST